jgi:hypothetical protein
MKPKVIKTESEHEAVLARIEKLMDARRAVGRGLGIPAEVLSGKLESAQPQKTPGPCVARAL